MSVTGRWFSLSTLISSTNKTDRHYIIEILLKVALSHKPNHCCVNQCVCECVFSHMQLTIHVDQTVIIKWNFTFGSFIGIPHRNKSVRVVIFLGTLSCLWANDACDAERHHIPIVWSLFWFHVYNHKVCNSLWISFLIEAGCDIFHFSSIRLIILHTN